MAQGAPTVGLDAALINPRLMLAVETAVIATLLLLLYIYRRRTYILRWMWGWFAMSAAAALTADPLQSDKLDAMAFGAARFLRVIAGLLFVVATDAYRRLPRLRRPYGLPLMPVASRLPLAPAG